MLLGDEKMSRIAKILHDPKLKTVNAKVERFISYGYGSRATFFNLKKIFKTKIAIDIYKPSLGKQIKIA